MAGLVGAARTDLGAALDVAPLGIPGGGAKPSVHALLARLDDWRDQWSDGLLH